MKNLTRIQRITIALLIGFIIWELAVRIWARNLPESDPLIRVDLTVLIPVLLLFIVISVIQFLKRKNT